MKLDILTYSYFQHFQGFQMSLFASLDMTGYQVRVMFLDRLRDEYETIELKLSILEFVTTCIGKQPGLTEAFFMINHEKPKEKENETEKDKTVPDDSFDGILGYMADYLGTVKAVSLFLFVFFLVMYRKYSFFNFYLLQCTHLSDLKKYVKICFVRTTT